MVEKLNKNELRAMRAICNDCDDIDGYGFTRIGDMMLALFYEFGDGHTAGGYMTALNEKNLFEIDWCDDCVWVPREIFSEILENSRALLA